MLEKFLELTAKKSAERKKTHYFIRLRTSRLLSHRRRSIILPNRKPLCITIGTDGLTQEQIDFLKELERKGLIPKITWIESSPNSFDEKMKLALLYLHSDEAKSLGCKMKRRYDYAWIKLAMDSKTMPERYEKYKYMSTPKFVDYIKSLGFTDIAGPKTINKALTNAKWLSESNEIVFRKIRLHISERKRRNSIALKFLEIMNEI